MPALTGYYCEEIPSRTTWSHLLLRKEEIRSNIWPKIPCQTLSKALDISTAQIALDLLKALAVLSDTAVRRSTVDEEDLKPYWKSEKGHIFLGDQQSYYLHVFQRFY